MVQSLSAEKVVRVELPAGNPGTDATVEEMAKASMGQYGAGSGRIRNLAVQIIDGEVGGLDPVDERDQYGEVNSVHEWVKAHLRYVRDPLWYEFVTMPETLAFERADGDCDDHVVLEAALLGAIGIPSRFVVYAFKGSPVYSHVAMQARVGNDWINLDPIVKGQDAGWSVPDATDTKFYGISTPDGTAKSVFSFSTLVGAAIAIAAVSFMFKRHIATHGRR